MAETKGTVTLRSVRTGELRFANKVEGAQVQIHFENKYSYNVKYVKAPGGQGGNALGKCRGEFYVRVCDRDLQDKFMVEATVLGFFEYTGDLPREEIHRRTYKELFPHVRALVTSVTSLCGIPPVIIPAVDIDRQDIYAIDMNGRKE